MLTVPLVQFLAPALLSWLEYGGERPKKLFQKPDVVRLSALNLLGAEDNPCDVRGREAKFCLRERLALRVDNGRDDDTPTKHVSQCPVEFDGTGGNKCIGYPSFKSRELNQDPWLADVSQGIRSFLLPDQLPHCDDYFVRTGTRVALDEVCLNGRGRVVIDGLLNQEECDLLLKLSESAAPGDGYGKGPHPLTKNELFVGVHSEELISRLKQSTENATAARLMLLASRKARLITEAYFRLKKRLYIHFAHLQCRIAMPNSTARRRDMSHNIHSDNCDFADNATCKCPDYKENLSWRDYSAAIYLNNDFHGGQTVFTKTPRTSIRGIVRPKCGRMVSFRSETAHGVLPVFTGRRCALLVWLTFTGREEEEARAEFDRLLRDIDGRVRKSSESDDRWDLLWNMGRT
ncbi:hypothetical protein MTO96_029437 [Rhipicephalus appendiculatus]